MQVGPGHLPDVDIGPMISADAKHRALRIIEQGVAQGARLALDGRSVTVPTGYEAGFFLGPTVLADVSTTNAAYTEEIFAPVLVTISVDTLEEATALVSASPYGNGCAIFTSSGAAARKFTHEVGARVVMDTRERMHARVIVRARRATWKSMSFVLPSRVWYRLTAGKSASTSLSQCRYLWFHLRDPSDRFAATSTFTAKAP